MDGTGSPSRCLGVAGIATGLLAALTAFLIPDLVAVVSLRGAGSGLPSFAAVLVHACAVAALLAATWLWAVTCTTALLAARGRADAATRGPVAVRRLVLAACGVALIGAVSGPAGAAPTTVPPHAERHEAMGPAGLAGLPMPDRTTGGVRAGVPAVRPTGGVPADRATRAPVTIVVRRGDTLWDLAAAHLPPGAGPAEITACWHRIHELNRDVIGDDPDLIQPDQRLRLPRR